MRLSKEELLNQLKPKMKNLGFRKKNNTWVTKNDKISIILNIQGSQFSTSEYYVNLGINLNELNSEEFPPIHKCHLVERVSVDIDTIERLIDILNLWIKWYGDIKSLKEKAINNKMPAQTQKCVYLYLLTCV